MQLVPKPVAVAAGMALAGYGRFKLGSALAHLPTDSNQPEAAGQQSAGNLSLPLVARR